MDDIWMLEMMKRKGMDDKEFSDFMKSRFTEFARGKGRGKSVMKDSMPSEHEFEMWKKQHLEEHDYDYDDFEDFHLNRHSDSEIYDVINSLSYEDKKRMMRLMAGEYNEHFGK